MKVLRALLIGLLLVGLLPLGAYAKAQRLERSAVALALAPASSGEAVSPMQHCKGAALTPCPSDPALLTAAPLSAPEWGALGVVFAQAPPLHEGRAPPGALDPPISG